MILMAEAYDPSEVEDRPRVQHFSKKDIRILAIVVLIGLILLYPVYMLLLGRRNLHVCKTQMNKISQAFSLYANDNSEMLPPAFVEAPDGPYPLEGARGINSWVTLLAGYVKGGSDAFFCPSAHSENAVMNEDPNVKPGDPRPDAEKTIASTYGMFAALAGQPISSVTSGSEAVLFSETNNLGTDDTWDQLKYVRPDGSFANDGIVIGLDTTNITDGYEVEDLEKARFATRLAFPGSANGLFDNDGGGRHHGGVNVIYVDGHISNKVLKPRFALVRRLGKSSEITGAWSGGLR